MCVGQRYLELENLKRHIRVANPVQRASQLRAVMRQTDFAHWIQLVVVTRLVFISRVAGASVEEKLLTSDASGIYSVTKFNF